MDVQDITPGPVCCVGDCCGPGSYCCGHPENEHEHPMCDQCNGMGVISWMRYDGNETLERCDKCGGAGAI